MEEKLADLRSIVGQMAGEIERLRTQNTRFQQDAENFQRQIAEEQEKTAESRRLAEDLSKQLQNLYKMNAVQQQTYRTHCNEIQEKLVETAKAVRTLLAGLPENNSNGGQA